jgi:dTDP-4-amino-4,6-dideoxygalactose transaminase
METIVPFADLRLTTEQLRPKLDAAWSDLLASGDFVRGHAVDIFEREWARYCGSTFAVGVGNGTDALWLALMALGIGVGDDVVVPANTFVATAEAVAMVGANPRFADVDPDTLLMTAETFARAVTPATKAVIVVHLIGQMADMDQICGAAAAAGVLVIEDAAQAHGASWRGRPAGSFGIAGCFSFYPGKNLGALGDGGAVVTSDEELARMLRCLRDHGRVDGSHHEHAYIGVNSRLDTLQAAVLSVKLRYLMQWTQARRQIMAQYRLQLQDLDVRLVKENPDGFAVYHLAVARVRDREKVRQALMDRGIQTGIHYAQPCHVMVPYRKYGSPSLPVVEEAAGEILSLPMFPHMSGSQVDRVCQALRDIMTPRLVSHV